MGTYYRNVEKYFDQVDAGIWIEIGTDRGEGSTQWFSDQALQRQCQFHGVDMDPDQIKRSRQSLLVGDELPDHITLWTGPGEQYLADLWERRQEACVSVVYLDNFDWDYWLGRQEEAFVAGVKQRYRDRLSVEMENLTSQATHLAQAMELIPLLTPRSVVICDDTWWHPQEGVFIGKCSAAIPFLMLHGFELVDHQGYRQNSGAILLRS